MKHKIILLLRLLANEKGNTFIPEFISKLILAILIATLLILNAPNFI